MIRARVPTSSPPAATLDDPKEGCVPYFVHVGAETLSEEQRAWLDADEALWRRAHEIVARHPGVDVSGVHHVLKNLHRSPEHRLRRGLTHGRLRFLRG